MWRSKALAIVVTALALVVVTDRLLLADDPTAESVDFADRLVVQPTSDGVFLLGNSMFKTGIDPELLAEDMGDITPVDFEYHNGHYTNLWYLISRAALGQTEEQPRVVVWGFRPRFAAIPAFRQNTENATDLFTFEDELFESLSTGQDFSNPDTFSSENVKDELEENSGIYSRRESARARLNDDSLEFGVDVLNWLGVGFADSLRTDVIEGDRSLADEIVRLVTDGEVVLTEELVIDDTGDFIMGPTVDFEGGFLPATAEAIEDAGLQQMVIIWRPIVAADGAPLPEEDLFVADAIEWLEAKGIPYLDLYHDERIGPALYGAGDHYNEDGRRLITGIVADELMRRFYTDG